ncbi:MAG: lipid-A-disaccharide synthase [bacterium]|nr:lipid-A-disaccharide synthase [bacterium]
MASKKKAKKKAAAKHKTVAKPRAAAARSGAAKSSAAKTAPTKKEASASKKLGAATGKSASLKSTKSPASKSTPAKSRSSVLESTLAKTAATRPVPVRSAPRKRFVTGGPLRDKAVLVIAGEHSGDLLGGDLVAELRQRGYSDFFGTGGPHMEAAGVELLEHVDNLAIIGFAEVLKAYRRLKALADRIVVEAVRRGTGFAVLVDYPGFNLRIAKMLQAAGIRIVYLASPQIWAWKYSRINTIRENVDLMLPLFKFEKEIYDREGVPCEWVGHPLISRIPRRLRREEALPLKIQQRPVIGIVPGSRRSEITRLLPSMLEAVRTLREKYPRARFLLAGVEERQAPIIEEVLAAYPDVEVELYYERSLRIMEASDVMMIASGTATLEGAFFRTPMVLLYKISVLNYMIAPFVIRTRFIGIVNLLARRQAILELIQSEVTPGNIVQEVERILEDRKYREGLVAELDYVRRELGRGNPAKHAAEAIVASPALNAAK